MENTFVGIIERFEMQGGWHFVSVPIELSKPLTYLAFHFGYISINAKVGSTIWPTSLLPKGDGTHFIALPAKVRAKEKLSLGAEIEVSFETRAKKQKRKNEKKLKVLKKAIQRSPQRAIVPKWDNCSYTINDSCLAK